MSRTGRWVLLLILFLSLAGCDQGEPGETSTATAAVEGSPANRATATGVEARTTTTEPSPRPTTVAAATGPAPTPGTAAAQAAPEETHTPAVLPTETPSPTPLPTDTPPPTPTPTEVRPANCPRVRRVDAPEQPTQLSEFPMALEGFLSAGASLERLEELLREWGAIDVGAGGVDTVDLTGDGVPEVVVSVIDPSPEGQVLPWPAGAVMVFRCEEKAMVMAYQAGAVTVLETGQETEEGGPFSYHMHPAADANGNGVRDLVYLSRSCGAHTCYDRLHVAEWDGRAFVELAPDMDAYPYPTFQVSRGQIRVKSAGIASAGAGIQRTLEEVWSCGPAPGERFVLTAATKGPPKALVHYVHDGDEAMARGDYPAAAESYQQALWRTGLPSGLLLESEEMGLAVVQGYARFKLVVAYAAAGDSAGAEARYAELVAAFPPGELGSRYTGLAEAFWNAYTASGDAWAACAVVVEALVGDPVPADRLYAGYANPEYAPADLCRLP